MTRRSTPATAPRTRRFPSLRRRSPSCAVGRPGAKSQSSAPPRNDEQAREGKQGQPLLVARIERRHPPAIGVAKSPPLRLILAEGLQVGPQSRAAHPVEDRVVAFQYVQIGGEPDVDV